MASSAEVLQGSDAREIGARNDDHAKVSIIVKIRRFNPEISQDSWWDEFELQADPLERLVEVLHTIKWHHDGTLTFRRSCAHGICGSDAMLINGRNALACKVLVADVGAKVTIEPIRGLPVLKDLIVDMEPFFDGYKSVLPFLINDSGEPERERVQSAEERERFDDTTKCILCAACTTSCPIFWGDEGYIGPAAIVNAHRFIFDSRDEAGRERLKILSEKTGVFRCRTTFNCTDACPRGIQVTKAIQEVKRSILFDRF
jgi:succinate dehydrogenase / fumarate reductase iron-sulfur subunit